MCTIQDQDEFSLNRPLYIKNREMQNNSNNKITDFELYKAMKGKIGDNILYIQYDRDLWRVLLKSMESRSDLLLYGFELRKISVKVYNSNLYSTVIKNRMKASSRLLFVVYPCQWMIVLSLSLWKNSPIMASPIVRQASLTGTDFYMSCRFPKKYSLRNL